MKFATLLLGVNKYKSNLACRSETGILSHAIYSLLTNGFKNVVVRFLVSLPFCTMSLTIIVIMDQSVCHF